MVVVKHKISTPPLLYQQTQYMYMHRANTYAPHFYLTDENTVNIMYIEVCLKVV